MGVINRLLSWILTAAVLGSAVAALLILTGVVRIPGLKLSHGSEPAAGKLRGQPEPVAVTVAPVTPRPIGRQVQVVGTLHGFDEVLITPKVEGRVVKLRHDVGDVVRPGDVLLEIEDVDFRLAVAEAERAVELELARVGLTQLPDKELNVAELPTVVRAERIEKNTLAKLERARRSGSGVSAEERDQMQTEYEVAQQNYRQAILEARATLAAARHRHALLATARQRLSETRVRAPEANGHRSAWFDALLPIPRRPGEPVVEYSVAHRMVSEGEMVRAFPSIAAFRLVREDPLKLQTTVPERYTGEVKIGQEVTLRVEAYPDEVFRGIVARVNPTVDRANRTFQVEVLVPNESRRLKAGSYCKAAIATREDAAAPSVPQEAITSFAGVTKVFVIRDGRAIPVQVQPGVRLVVKEGDRSHNWIEVHGRISADDLVVTSGQSQLADGTPVRVRGADK